MEPEVDEPTKEEFEAIMLDPELVKPPPSANPPLERDPGRM